MTTILLARHGESDWNREARWQGWADRPLTVHGRAQAKALAERVAHIRLDGVFSSDLERARETAKAVADLQGLPVTVDRDLREIDVGSWSGLTRAAAEARYPDAFARWREGSEGWADGETYDDLSDRVLAAVRRIARAHDGGCVLVVTHGGPIRAIHAAALDLEVQTYRRLRPVEPNARLSVVCVVDGELTELCPAAQIDEMLELDQRDRRAAARRPPTPAG